MELFDDVNVAQEMYVKAAGALLAKPFMTSFDLERAAELYEASSIDPDNADIRYQAAARYRMDAAQRWLYVGETVKAIRNADLALQDIEFIRVPTAREDKAKAVELKERAMAMLTAEAPMIRDHYAVRVPADTVLAYLKQQNSTSAGAFEITLVQTAVYYALKNHEAEMRPLLKDGALTVEACQKARELWKKGSK